jgi:hypothetical protein
MASSKAMSGWTPEVLESIAKKLDAGMPLIFA